MSQGIADTSLPEVSSSEAHAELEAILRSRAFERSERLQRFLRFICELTLNGEGGRINEYLIGSEVFQRGSGYSPSEDSIVRRQAHTLRQKLHDFYAAEGAEHSVRIELPVGRYVPVFRRMQPTVELDGAPPAVTVASPQSRRFPGILIAGGICLLLTGALAGWWMRAPGTKPVQTEIGSAASEIWAPWIADGREAVVCFSNPLTAIIKHYNRPLPPDAEPKRFRAHPDEEVLFRDAFGIRPGGAFYYTPVVNQTKMGEAIAAVHLATLLTKAGLAVRTTQSRFLSWEDLRKDNLILLGHNEANKWMEVLLKDQPFRLAETADGDRRGIVNARPAPGEKNEYHITYSQSENEGDEEYALISMLPGMDQKRPLLIISGLNTQATQVATEYLTSESSLKELLNRLKKASPDHTGSWHFQAVLRTEVYDKVPTGATLVSLRVL